MIVIVYVCRKLSVNIILNIELFEILQNTRALIIMFHFFAVFKGDEVKVDAPSPEQFISLARLLNSIIVYGLVQQERKAFK